MYKNINLGDMDFNVYLLRMFFIEIFTCYIFLKITNNKIPCFKKLIISIIYLSINALLVTWIKYNINYLMSITYLIFLLSLLCSKITRSNVGYTIVTLIVSLSFNYIIFFLVILITFLINVIYAVKNDFLNLTLIVVLQTMILYRILKVKRLKNGISFFNKNSQDEYFDVIILNISVIILFSIIIFGNIDTFASIDILISKSFFISFIIFAIIMIITIQKSLQLYYKKNLLVKELEDTKAELESKNKEIEKLEQENLAFSKKSHSIAHKQKSLEYKLNQLLQNSEIAEAIDISDRVNKLSTELYTEKKEVELTKTGITQIDDMLKYMQSECTKENIEFDLQINGNIYYMINNLITVDELEILIADHVKDAIIAIQHSDNINRSILVRLGKIDNCYSLYIYDSGIEFEKETLSKLGKEPCSTHLDEGGTGMGFLNTFDTLRKHNASMIINELNPPCKEDFTKAIIIKFDNKNEFKIVSYREQVKEEQKV